MKMDAKTKSNVRYMLMEAYCRLGILSVKELDGWVNEAMTYLSQDREHYVEAVEPKVPEHSVSVLDGQLCRLIPLAREVRETQRSGHIRRHTRILSLMVTSAAVRYVCADSYADIHPDAEDNTYTYPVYKYTELEGISDKMQIGPPGEIRPPATAGDWKIFCKLLDAFAHFCRDQHINRIPHKAERAMLAVLHAAPQELTMNGKTVTGKVIPLATAGSVESELREDHRYTTFRELCLLIAGEEIRYLMKTRHSFQYVRKVTVDEEPCGWIFEPGEEKQEITYEFVELSDIRQEMYPLYY